MGMGSQPRVSQRVTKWITIGSEALGKLYTYNHGFMTKVKAGKNSTVKSRASNIELLRIISMMMVVIVHLDGGCLGIPRLEGDWSGMDGSVLWRMGVESLAFIGVNCFTLISGYFGIRLRWKSVAAYLFECIFYAVGIYSVVCFLTPGLFSWAGLGKSFLVLTHTDLWYVPAYFLLMLLSPLINAGFAGLSRRKGMMLTLAFTVFNLWAGWWWGGKFNASGYTAWQLVMMYCIGRVIAAYKEELYLLPNSQFPSVAGGRYVESAPKVRFGERGRCITSGIWFGCYLVCSVLTVIMGVYDFRRAYSYNQPFVILASVTFFLFFASIRFRSGFVNYAARSAFAVYLLHKSPLIWGRYLRPAIIHLWSLTTLAEFTILVAGITVAVYLVAMLIDMVRRIISRILFQ